MKRYRVPVTIDIKGFVYVEANTLAGARKQARVLAKNGMAPEDVPDCEEFFSIKEDLIKEVDDTNTPV